MKKGRSSSEEATSRDALGDFFIPHPDLVKAFNEIEGHQAKSGISSHLSPL